MFIYLFFDISFFLIKHLIFLLYKPIFKQICFFFKNKKYIFISNQNVCKIFLVFIFTFLNYFNFSLFSFYRLFYLKHLLNYN
ncbi:hypothetical protein CPZ25_004715 [Eubacterium maltosivorans]|uniref:Uncharacterized protein n=1 Tax=Eubacterium maltosivorans TaxID=2041044 RepID=A0A2A5TGC0_EUBML|nr:hypothetical protein CPZ25_004715 [Eubacterium maltosivorans]